jgi:hypothetical protein
MAFGISLEQHSLHYIAWAVYAIDILGGAGRSRLLPLHRRRERPECRSYLSEPWRNLATSDEVRERLAAKAALRTAY